MQIMRIFAVLFVVAGFGVMLIGVFSSQEHWLIPFGAVVMASSILSTFGFFFGHERSAQVKERDEVIDHSSPAANLSVVPDQNQPGRTAA